MKRIDLSDYLVHWTKPVEDMTALDVLMKIINERKILAGNGMIKGGFNCICFTEAPKNIFHNVEKNNARYHPFGICVPKIEIFRLGGRPVIYQQTEEFDLLHESQQWRHVTYDPFTNIDFTWEREWRLHRPQFNLEGTIAEIIVPNEDCHSQLLNEHQYNEEWRIWGDIVGYGDFAGFQEPNDFPFRIVSLQNIQE
ncbi:hypothetical protein [Pseudidiomarina andamanensis]|uniref:Uncharacterized protein n=1 Tax=Pseudidiomarina andamanensis TaxID=1940690 RepID=A0AA92ETP7_9GAMM|nr:hypothetical protein [Pseudidiomarina andamanensis]MDS0218631.1 hypothetical protein [Pseudidiomarina andamanensis]QGT95496.1 hypothetical protein D3795_04570 [Pseudidiomarina andamanensis]